MSFGTTRGTIVADVVVAGGGPAGWAAAVAAARNGANTILVERYGFLGGMATTGLPLLAYHDKFGRQTVGGIAAELVERLVSCGGSPGYLIRPLTSLGATLAPVDGEMVKYLMMCMTEEAGARLLLHSAVVAPLTDGSEVRGIIVENKSGRQTIQANVVIDATGDGDVAARAGVPFEKGRNDGRMQPASLMFRVYGVDLERVVQALDIEEIIRGRRPGQNEESIICVMGTFRPWNDILRERNIFPDDNHRMWITSLREGEADINTSRVLDVDGTDADSLTRAECSARRQVFAILEFLNGLVPGFEHVRLAATAHQIGVRETRRFLGREQVGESYVRDGLNSPNGIARCAYAVDIHSPSGDGILLQGVGGGGSYAIPYGALIPLDVKGLLLAGRCISTTHVSLASARIMPTMMAVGEAAGTAAAIAARNRVYPDEVNVSDLRACLQAQGAILD